MAAAGSTHRTPNSPTHAQRMSTRTRSAASWPGSRASAGGHAGERRWRAVGQRRYYLAYQI